LGALKTNRALQFILGSLFVLFFMLSAGEFTGIKQVTVLAGYVGIICGLSAVYLSVAQILNETYGKSVLPVCPVK